MNKQEFEKLYLESAPQVYRYSMFMLKQKELAEDVTSETFARLLEKGISNEVKDRNAWSIGIARNIIYDKYKRNRKVKTTSNESINEDLDENVERKSIDDLMIKEIQNELENLDETSKEIIVLKIWQDLKFKQIANILSIKTNTVKSTYYRGLEQIKINLQLRSKNKKLYSVSIPVIAAGIATTAKSGMYMANSGFLSTLASNLGLSVNLNIINSYMSANIASAAATSATSSTATSGILATTGAKIAAIAVTTTAVVAGGAGIAVVNNQSTSTSQSNTISQPVSYTNSRVVEDYAPIKFPEELAFIQNIVSWSTPSPTTFEWLSDNGSSRIEINGAVSSATGERDDLEEVSQLLLDNGFSANKYNLADGISDDANGETISISRSGFEKDSFKVVLVFTTGNNSEVDIYWGNLDENDIYSSIITITDWTKDDQRFNEWLTEDRTRKYIYGESIRAELSDSLRSELLKTLEDHNFTSTNYNLASGIDAERYGYENQNKKVIVVEDNSNNLIKVYFGQTSSQGLGYIKNIVNSIFTNATYDDILFNWIVGENAEQVEVYGVMASGTYDRSSDLVDKIARFMNGLESLGFSQNNYASVSGMGVDYSGYQKDNLVIQIMQEYNDNLNSFEIKWGINYQ